MSSIVVKPIDEFTFEDAQLATPLYIGDTVGETTFTPRESSIYPSINDEKTGVSKLISIENNHNPNDTYKVFVRRYDDPPKKEEDFGEFLDKNFEEYDSKLIWVILDAKNMKEAINSFKGFMKTGLLKRSNSNTARDNDPIVKKKKEEAAAAAAAVAKATEAEASKERERKKQAAAKEKEDKRNAKQMLKKEEEEETKKIQESGIGTVKTIEQMSSIDELLNATSLFVCEVYDPERHKDKESTTFRVDHKGFRPNHWDHGLVDGHTYKMIIRRSSLFDEKGQIPTDVPDKKKLFERIVLEPFYEYSSSKPDNKEYNVFFVLDATDETSAKYAFLKHINAKVRDRYGESYRLDYTCSISISNDPKIETSKPADHIDRKSVISIPLTKNDAFGYVNMSIKKSFPPPPPPPPPPVKEGEESKAVVKYLDEMTPQDVKSAVSIFICQPETNFLDSIKHTFLRKPDFYEIKRIKIQAPVYIDANDTRNLFFVVRKSVFSDEYGLELYNKTRAFGNEQPVSDLSRESPDFFEKVVLDPFIQEGHPDSVVVWYILNARSLEDAIAAVKERFHLKDYQHTDTNTDSYTTDTLIYSKGFTFKDAESYGKNPSLDIKKPNPVGWTRVHEYKQTNDLESPEDEPEEEEDEPEDKLSKPSSTQPANLPGRTADNWAQSVYYPFSQKNKSYKLGVSSGGRGGGRGRTTRKKSRKSIKRTKRSKSVKRHSRSKSRKSRTRK